MKKDEIRATNRRALPRFLLVLAVSMVIGGAAGFGSAKFRLDKMAGAIQNVGMVFGMHIAPWLMAAIAVIAPVICIPVYRGARKLLNAWDGENEDISDEIDRKLSIAIWFSSASLVFSYFLIAAAYSGGFAMFDNTGRTLALCVAIAGFFAVLIEAILLQQKCVDAARQINPEKKASVYDMRFQRKWMEDCDEAERLIIGKCAYKAYSATNTVCTVLAIVLAIGALVFEIGFLPSLMVCLVWIVNLSVYCREALRYSKAGNRIS